MRPAEPWSVEPLGSTPLPVVHDAFVRAFSDYGVPMALSVAQLRRMLDRRGYDPTLSLGAFVDGRLVGFILNAIGPWNDRLTAYDTGTGLDPGYRRRGIATQLMGELVPLLVEHGVTQYLLEVLQENTSAFDLYRKQGFEVTRSLSCYAAAADELRTSEISGPGSPRIRPVAEPAWDRLRSFWDFAPSWQNSVDSIRRQRDRFEVLVAFDGERAVGYGAIESDTGDLPQLAIDRSHRGSGLGTALLARLASLSATGGVRVINVDSGDRPFRKFARRVGLAPEVDQYEMILSL